MEIRAVIAPARPPNLIAHHKAHHHRPLHPQSHHQDQRIHTFLKIIIPIILIVILFAAFLIIVILHRLKSSRNNGSSKTSSHNGHSTDKLYKLPTNSTTSLNSSPDVKSSGCLYGGNVGKTPPAKFRGVQVFTYKELEMATDRFSEENMIGSGKFGVVYRGVLSDGSVAAIKMVHWEGKQAEREFRIEVDLLCRLNSPYLVDLLGYCADQHHRLLVFEFMPNGNLQHHLYLSHKQYQPLDWGIRLRIALDCARALEFLHEHAIPSVIHRNFKCSTVLLDHNFRAKVSDFRFAKTGSDKIYGQISTNVLGTTGYLAPEYASMGKLTTKSDVYSYGVVLLELLTGRVPVDINRPPGEHVLVSWALPRLTNREKVFEMVDPALQHQCTKKELIQVAAIAAVCVQAEADYRPLMTDVVQSLIPLVKSLPPTYSTTSSSRFYNRTAIKQAK